jgi:hypothetical protein
VILGQNELAWQEKVTAEAMRLGWTPYAQVLRNERQHDPSVVLVHGERVIVAYLRTKSPRARPPLERFAGVAQVETYVWCPADWSLIRVVLMCSPGSK